MNIRFTLLIAIMIFVTVLMACATTKVATPSTPSQPVAAVAAAASTDTKDICAMEEQMQSLAKVGNFSDLGERIDVIRLAQEKNTEFPYDCQIGDDPYTRFFVAVTDCTSAQHALRQAVAMSLYYAQLVSPAKFQPARQRIEQVSILISDEVTQVGKYCR